MHQMMGVLFDKTSQAGAICRPEIVQLRRLARVYPEDLLHLVRLGVDPADITARKDLPRRCDRAGKAVSRPRSGVEVVEMWGEKIRHRDAFDLIGVRVSFARVASLDEVFELSGAVSNLVVRDRDCRGSLQPVPSRVDQHLNRFVARVNGPFIATGCGDDLGIGLIVPRRVITAFARRQRPHYLHRPNPLRNLFMVRQVGDRRVDRPELRKVTRDLDIERRCDGRHRLGVDRSGRIREPNLHLQHRHLLHWPARAQREF